MLESRQKPISREGSAQGGEPSETKCYAPASLENLGEDRVHCRGISKRNSLSGEFRPARMA